jgi:hypothetical protein
MKTEVENRDGMYIKTISPGRMGWPDRQAFLPNGIHLVFELKAPDGRPSPHQEANIRRLQRLGHRAFFVYSIEEGREYLDYHTSFHYGDSKMPEVSAADTRSR